MIRLDQATHSPGVVLRDKVVEGSAEAALARANAAYAAAQQALANAATALAAAEAAIQPGDVSTTAAANKIPRADGAGKIDADYLPPGGFDVLTGTRDEILATTPTANTWGIPSDKTGTMLFVVGLGWLWQPAAIFPRSAPDIGLDNGSAPDGYGEDYIDDKLLSRCRLSGEGVEIDGGLRCKKNDFGQKVVQAFRDGFWYTALMGRSQFTVNVHIQQGAVDVEFEDLGMAVSLITGDSDILDLDGKPLVQQMNMPIGCYSGRQYIYGGRWE